MVYFSVQLLFRQTEEVKAVQQLRVGVAETIGIMNIVDELQKERRYTVRYYFSHSDNVNEMLLQRSKTDAAINNLETKLQIPATNFENNSLLALLNAKRKLMDNNEMSQHAAMQYFSAIILRLNGLVINNLPDIPAARQLNPYLRAKNILSQMTTYLGIMRLDLYMLLVKGSNDFADVEQMQSNLEIYNSLLAEFDEQAPSEIKVAWQRASENDAYHTTMDVIGRFISSRQIDQAMQPENWWANSINGLRPLKEVETNLIANINSSTGKIYDRQSYLRIRSFIILILLIGLVLYIIGSTLRNMAAQLRELEGAAIRIARGATGVKLPAYTRDSIGQLTKAFAQIDQHNVQLAQAANDIGQGRLNVVIKPRSAEDLLGQALVRMRNDLKAYQDNNNQALWVQTGLNELSEKLIVENDLQSLGKVALHTLANYLQAHVGVLYIRNQQWLEFSAGYALNERFPVPEHIAIGKTLLGEAAEKRQVLLLQHTADDFIRISSATAETMPAHTLIVPLLHNRQVEGVVELGATQPFASGTKEYVEEAAGSIAIALQSARGRLRMQELLEETQSQTEELQTQHSELEALNKELSFQTQKLQASDEELRVQQEELQQNNAELTARSRLLEEMNQVITARNLDIQRQAEALTQSTRYKSEFMANMSHELRTPLNSILLLSRLLEENHGRNLNEEQVEYAQVILKSGKGLLSLIDEILDLSKIESGKMELEYQPVKLALLLEDLKALYNPMAREKGLEIFWELQEGTPEFIETDRQRLDQVLKNLLSNALKFTQKGGIYLQVSALGAEEVQFRVKDTGIGIPLEKQDVIFEAFRQADGTTRRQFGGTGLGLSISREITKLLGGRIAVESVPEEGSTFIVVVPIAKPAVLPVAPAPVVAAPERVVQPVSVAQAEPAHYIADFIPEPVPDDRAQLHAGDKIILIIEDDRAFAKALLDYTRARGYKGLVAVRGDQGIQLAREFRPLGILLDIMLPIKDGWQVMDALKSDPLTRPIPVHMMSSMEMKKESLNHGAIDFINKPVAFEQLPDVFAKLEYVLNKHPKKVLIVEENAQHAKALAYFLGTYQVNTEIIERLDDGLKLLLEKDIDCVILDMGIPDPRIYETLEALKVSAGMESVPVVIFTGKNLSKLEEQRIHQYADSIVIKTAHSYQRILDEISLFLHLVEEQNISATPRSKSPMGNGLNEVLNGKTVLVADDDVRNIYSLTKSLEKHHMNVISAIDGKEALDQLELHPVDIVLMDMMMPEMDGYETIAHIRDNHKWRQLPVIAVTAKVMMGDREKCIAAGASDYISKPVDVDQLLSLLRVWLYDKGKKY
ncbi:Signal transduction histidine kinase [Chitinophaga costaii]|uniref:histidine kinase n=1 Tax=Chitinophaga costaii TaxID=1335309 RepID=A0A1C4CBN3_9BACT|nr:response regulator [Chitinophaga costaii]SCC16448.1 Signal transduction histidine kinase [Chitinophaga costaii]